MKVKKQFLIKNNKIFFISTNKDKIILMVKGVVMIILQETNTIILIIIAINFYKIEKIIMEIIISYNKDTTITTINLQEICMIIIPIIIS